MVTKRPGRRYTLTAALLLLATLVMDIIAKAGPLSRWSALADVIVNVVLVAAAIAALVVGAKKDRQFLRSSPDDDY
jgi:hypothetical protein